MIEFITRFMALSIVLMALSIVLTLIVAVAFKVIAHIHPYLGIAAVIVSFVGLLAIIINDD